jgi:hypothetical protein
MWCGRCDLTWYVRIARPLDQVCTSALNIWQLKCTALSTSLSRTCSLGAWAPLAQQDGLPGAISLQKVGVFFGNGAKMGAADLFLALNDPTDVDRQPPPSAARNARTAARRVAISPLLSQTPRA